MMPGRSVRSAKCSGVTLNESQTGAGSSGVTANILPLTLNRRSLPHWTCSVAPGKERQRRRRSSIFMGIWPGDGIVQKPGRLSVSRKKLGRKQHFGGVRLARMKSLKIGEATFFARLASKKSALKVRERVHLA